MTNDRYLQAVSGAVLSRVARMATVVAHRFNGLSLHKADRARATLAGLQGLARLRSGPGAVLTRAADHRPASQRGERSGAAGRGIGVLVPPLAQAIARRSSGQGSGFRKTSASLRRKMLIVRAAGPALGAMAGGGHPLVVEPRHPSFRPAGITQRRLAGGASVAQRSGLAARILRGGGTYRSPAMLAPKLSAGHRRHIAMPAPQPADTPGFHRTVKQTPTTAAAGDVYLDRALVGYHLAAAITAEQTRAAARPSISGSSFNSSMAALRPSGASL